MRKKDLLQNWPLSPFIICLSVLILSGCTISPQIFWPPFDLSIFINKIFDTVLEIIVVFIGFVLLNVFWNRREENRKASPYRDYMQIQTEFIGRISKHSVNLLEEAYPPQEYTRVEKRNELIKEHILRIKIISDAVEKVISNGYEKIDGRTLQGFAFFQTYVSPTIIDLLKYSNEEVQPSLVEIDNTFRILIKQINELIAYMKGDSNDLSPLI